MARSRQTTGMRSGYNGCWTGNKMQSRMLTAAAALFGAIIFLGIGILAYGSFTAYMSDPARAALTIVYLLFTVASLFTNSSGIGSGVREDRSGRWILIPVISISLIMMFVSPFLDRHNILTWGGEPMRWAGVIVTAVGGVLRLGPVFELGKRFSGLVAIQEGHTLETHGFYRFIRHPSYLGLLMGALGWPLAFREPLIGVVGTAVIAAAMIVRMNSEERLLLDEFKDQYAAYRSHTWRLIPWVY